MTARQAASPASAMQQWSDRCFAFLPYVSFLGLASLVANLMLSFEQPHWEMLVVAAALLMVAPVGMVAHLLITSELSPAEKRMWFAGLTGRQGPTLFAAYFRGSRRRRATHMLSQACRRT
jgi:hypothetical protein